MKFSLRGLFGQRESAATRTAWLDTAINQAAARAHTHQLQTMRAAQRSFEAAETPAWAESWPTHAATINEDLARQLPTLRARARAQARNDEWATSYLIKLEDNVLGDSGIRLQMRLKTAAGEQDKTANALLESAWDRFCELADVAGYTWRTVESLALRSLPTDGAMLYRLRPGAGPMGFQIQMLDDALLDVTLHREWGGHRVRMGVEITDDGKPIAYWLLMAKTGDLPSDLVSVGRHIRVPAEQIVHRYRVTECGQLRGVPWLAAGAQRLWMLHDFEQAAAVASANAAKRQGFFVSPDGEAPPGFADTIVSSVLDAAKAAGKVLSPDEIQTLTSAAEKFTTTLPGQYDVIPRGYDFRQYDSAWPNITAESYVKQHVRGWAAARGMSYVTAGNDLEAVNYSSSQIGIVGEREHFKKIQQETIAWLHGPVFKAALPYLILSTPGLKMARIADYLAAATWQTRRWQAVDPVKAENANVLRLKQRTTSRRRIILERGEDPDEIAAEIAEEEKIYGPYTDGPAATTPVDSQAEEDAEDPADPATEPGKKARVLPRPVRKFLA